MDLAGLQSLRLEGLFPHLIMGVGRTPQMLALVPCCLTLAKSLPHSGPKLPHLCEGQELGQLESQYQVPVPALATFQLHDLGRVSISQSLSFPHQENGVHNPHRLSSGF